MSDRIGMVDGVTREPPGDRPVCLLDGTGLTAATVAEIARGRVSVRLGDDAAAANQAAWHLKQRLAGRGRPLYGCTTEVGARSAQPAAATSDAELALLRGHACGAGRLLPADQVRAALAVRVNQLARGGAGVSPPLLDTLVQTLNLEAIPQVHELGSLGTADLTALAEIGLAVAGEGRWCPSHRHVPPPVQLGSGDAIGLLSSNACTLGQAALACHDTRWLLRSAEAAAALSFLASRADPAALDDRVQQARPHPGQLAAAAHLRRLVGPAGGSGRLQDALCCRCLPQVQGAARDAAADLDRVLDIELNAAAENPLIVAEVGEARCNGNFHTARLAQVTDQLRAALTHAASLAAARLSALLDPTVTGLPGFLVGPDDARTGAMVLEYPAHDALAELRACATPVTTTSTIICGGVENHASFTALAARQLDRALNHYATVVGCELVVAIRALRMAGRTLPTAAGQAVFDRAAAVLPYDLADRPMSDDIAAAAELLRTGLADTDPPVTP